MKQILLSCAIIVFSINTHAQLKKYRKFPVLNLSPHYVVEIKQGTGNFEAIFTYQIPQNANGHVTKNDQFSSFGFNPANGSVQIRVTRKDGQPLNSLNSRLGNKTLQDVSYTHNNGGIIVTCEATKRHLYIQVDGKMEFPLMIFVDPFADKSYPSNAKIKVFEAKNSAHVINTQYDRYTVPNDIDVVVIEDGAIVKGTIHTKDGRNKPLLITGRGILMGNGEVLHGAVNIPYNALVTKKGSGHTIENITIINSRHFTLDAGQNSIVDNVKMYGYDTNNDGIVAFDNCVIQNVFSKVNDDHLKIYHENVIVRNCTYWEQQNGAIWQLAWNKIVPGSNCVIENCEILAWEAGCGDPKLGQGGIARSLINLREYENTNTPTSRDNIFQNIYVQGKMDRFICVNAKYGGSKPINLLNYQLINVTIEETPKKYSWLYTGGSGKLEFSFKNVKIAGQCITKDNYQFNTEGNVELNYLDCNTNNNHQPSDITDLIAAVHTCNSVELNWSDVQHETGYRIRRKLENDLIFTNLTDVPINSTNYTDESAEESTSYVYMVRPLTNDLAVALSNQETVSTPSCIITEVKVTEAQKLNFFPNPIRDKLNLSFSSNWRLFESTGRLIRQGYGSVIDLSGLSKGVYVITVNEKPYRVLKD